MNRPKTLSATFVRTLTRPGRYGDGRGGHGLSLMVRPTKIEGRLSKTWVQRIRINGKETNLGLGSYPAVTLAEARRRALGNRQAVEEGRNPRARKAPTFRQATEKVIRLHAAKWKPGGRSEESWRSTLRTYAYPRFGNKRVDLITTADVMACLAPVWHQRPETASRVKQRIAAVMRWCIAQGFRENNPADDRITAALGSNTKRPQHMKALHHSQVGNAVRAVEATDAHWATIAAFKFLTLTATRSGEVRHATWDEIDLSTATWTIPSEHTKTGRAHRTPLSTGALAVLATALPHSGGKGLIFPSPTGRTLSNATMSKLCKENKIGCVPHGMRTSFRNWCGETGVSREVAERALGHEIRNAVERAYARTDLLESRRQLMEEWSCYLGM
ncbi:MAG: tyrosine-type recombinase/integrase [bacterium]|nr:tyrosine-type recombinase/integrase [bacterium]MDE0600610.1 tyrosine-type recombinase/integrase [bacterium]